MLLSAHMILHRAQEFDYPFREAIRSVLPIADDVHLVVDPTEEGLLDACDRIDGQGKIHIHAQRWWNPARKEECLADATNFAIEQCRGEWHLALQADEVVHEDDYATLLAACAQKTYPWVELERLNLYGSFDHYNANRERWPCSVVRLARTEWYPHIRSYADATHLGIPESFDPRITPRLDLRDQAALWHYSYTRAGRAFVDRQASMARLYGLNPDPLVEAHRERGQVDWWGVIPRAEFRPLSKDHPRVMREWIAKRRAAVESGAWELA